MRILVTGASRGLGLEFAAQYLAAGHDVAALARNPAGSNGLQALAAEAEDRLVVHACDVADGASIEAAAQAVAARWDALDLLVNNAGVSGDKGKLTELDFDDMAAVFATNAIGPLRVTRALLPLLRKGSAAKVAHITSRMGSIADNGSGGWWAYRMSKAALNMACRNATFELDGEGVSSYVLHPGWVQTDMGGGSAPLSIAESVRSMIGTIAGLTPADSGRFVNYDGEALPW